MAQTIYDLIEELTDKLNDALEDATAFDEKGNKAAGRRVRAVLLDVKNDCHDLRKDISERSR